jgi:hypothetical protein
MENSNELGDCYQAVKFRPLLKILAIRVGKYVPPDAEDCVIVEKEVVD